MKSGVVYDLSALASSTAGGCCRMAADVSLMYVFRWRAAMSACKNIMPGKDRSIRRMAELMGDSLVGQIGAPTDLRSDGRRMGPQHQKGIATRIAEQTGLSKRTVQRALNSQASQGEPRAAKIPDADTLSKDEQASHARTRALARARQKPVLALSLCWDAGP